MAGADGDDSLYPIAVLIDELRNEDVQVPTPHLTEAVILLFSEAIFAFSRPGILLPAS